MIHWLRATLKRELVFERRGHCLHMKKGDNWAYCCHCPLDIGEGEYIPWGCWETWES